MANLNKSFLYGICFASVMWIISFYVYLSLTDTHLFTKSKTHIENFLKNQIPFLSTTQYKNSEKFIKQLQPITTKLNTTSLGLSELGLIKSDEDQFIRDEGYKLHAYNVLVSDRLGFDRRIPDTRNELCKTVAYPDVLPTASVIICFYNEHLNTLLRSLHSIINRTPSHLLKEIILVDDFSDVEDLHNTLNEYINNHFKGIVKLFKTEKREGLIRARVFGTRKSVGDVLVFLDSHIEVNINWLEPLLSRIKQNKANVVMPIIDIINADTFAYTPSHLVRGGFNWGLHFKWDNLPKGTLATKEDFVKPIKSPTMAGGLFAIDREYFVELGEYDDGMDIWGGENLEISFRIWLCGGNLELIPCSRVGHVFRKRRPYGSPDGKDTLLHNSLRVAHVWMDDYKKYFYEQRPEAQGLDYGDISSRINLRKQLKCQDFDWYLKNVYPELTLPSDDSTRLKKKWAALEHDQFQPWHSRKRNYINQFQLKLSNTSLCIQSKKDFKTKGSSLVLKRCLRNKNQMWFETDKNELILAQLFCLQAGKSNVYLYKCHEMGGDQEWKYKEMKNTPIYNIAAGTCLSVNEKKVNALVVMKLCTKTNMNEWDLVA